MRSKLTPRGQERREQLITCAARLFAERGYHPTSVADIVAALGVGKGVFYWYFASKEELLTELLKASNHELRKRQQQAIGDEADPVRRIELGIRATLDVVPRSTASTSRSSSSPRPTRRSRRCSPATARSRSPTRSATSRTASSRAASATRDPEMLAHAIHGVVAELTRDYLLERNETRRARRRPRGRVLPQRPDALNPSARSAGSTDPGERAPVVQVRIGPSWPMPRTRCTAMRTTKPAGGSSIGGNFTPGPR